MFCALQPFYLQKFYLHFIYKCFIHFIYNPPEAFCKNSVLKNFANSQESTSAGVLLNKVAGMTAKKKMT